MGLMQGSLESLVSGGPVPDNLGDLVLMHILRALDFLAVQDIVHRDVKPENILYAIEGDRDYFQLGDFGLSNRTSIAATFTSSPLYMAPEMFREDQTQTHKVDIWSLYVTILWTLDVAGFRWISEGFKSIPQARNTVLAASKAEKLAQIREMVKADPNYRASAAQMLVKIYGGKGLTTPRHRVPRLEPIESLREPGLGPPPSSATSPPVTSTVPNPAAAAPSKPPGRRAAGSRARGVRGKDARLFPATPAAVRQFRVA